MGPTPCSRADDRHRTNSVSIPGVLDEVWLGDDRQPDVHFRQRLHEEILRSGGMVDVRLEETKRLDGHYDTSMAVASPGGLSHIADVPEAPPAKLRRGDRTFLCVPVFLAVAFLSSLPFLEGAGGGAQALLPSLWQSVLPRSTRSAHSGHLGGLVQPDAPCPRSPHR